MGYRGDHWCFNVLGFELNMNLPVASTILKNPYVLASLGIFGVVGYMRVRKVYFPDYPQQIIDYVNEIAKEYPFKERKKTGQIQ
jgi:hypothetical protein